MQREKELDAKREKKRAQTVLKLAKMQGRMEMDDDRVVDERNAKRVKRAEPSEGAAGSEMAIESPTASASVSLGEHEFGKKVKFGKMKLGSKKGVSIRGASFLPDRKKIKEAKKLMKLANPSAAPVRPSLELRKRSGIKKPSSVMRKTFKKMAKARAMEL